ncbi:hypothetical protein BD414DRAFT_229465 [Trametes punicea]|nr:hypothetical protein BD414DRAFT_229465 [Trametes punicea]
MSTASPTAFLLWSILSILFLVFLVHHLWCYDRFKCLRWSAGRQPGAFKRVMTYSYLGAVPLFAFYSIGMTVIKYREGFVMAPDGAFAPRPIDMYREPNRGWVLPLQFVFSIAFALEQVTHLEELAFWLYLLHQNPNKEAWFSSWEYRLWYMGSLVALIGLPLTALVTRKNLDTVDAYIFLVGSAGSTSTTISFLYVLWRFPKFIRHVKAEGADPTVVVRLATFYQLNQARVVFRFLFTLPLLVLALDGIIGHSHPVNRNLFLTDFFQMIAGIGCFVSSMITLLIFFPRSIVREAGYKPKLSSTIAASPKSPPITPPSRSAPFPPHAPSAHHHLPMHISGAPVPQSTVFAPMTETEIAGVTSWEMESAYTPSACSPRESLYDSPQYTAEDYYAGAGERVHRRGSSRRGAGRRASAPNPMDAHRERDTDDDADDEDDLDADAELDAGVDADDESVPPYSRHSHHHAHPQHQPRAAPHPLQPAQAYLYQRHPFPHSLSSPQIVTVSQAGARTSSLPPPPPPPPPPAATDARPSSPSSKRHTWGWEEARHAASFGFGLAEVPDGNGSANASRTANAGGMTPRGTVQVVARGPAPNAVNVGTGGAAAGAGGGIGLGMSVGLVGRRVSSLHPYVVNFTSPIDLIDLPPADELPRSM